MTIKRIMGMIIAIIMIVSLIPQSTLLASAETTIYFQPSEVWKSAGDRYAVHYFAENYDGWIDVYKTSTDGYYSVSIPECMSFQFCIMLPESTANNHENVMHYSGEFYLPADVTEANCLELHEGLLDDPYGDWKLIEELSASSAETTIFFYPSEVWKETGGRYAVYYAAESHDGWVSVSEVSGDGCYSVNIPECMWFQFCIMMPDFAENSHEYIMYSSAEFYLPEDTAEANCVTLHEGLLDSPGGDWSLFNESSPSYETTIFFHPSESWNSVGGRYTVNYTTDSESYDGWVSVREASIDGYYSVNIPECSAFTFCVMVPGSSTNNHDNVQHCSVMLRLPTDVTEANCFMLFEDTMDDPAGEWILHTGLSVGDNTGDGGEEGGSEEDIANSNVIWYEGTESHYGILTEVVELYSDVEIKLIKNIELTSPLVIAGNKHIEIDFCGYTVTLVDNDSFATVSRYATLNLYNTGENGVGGVEALAPANGNALISVAEAATLNIHGGNYCTLDNVVIQMRGENPSVTITDGSFVTEMSNVLIRMSGGNLTIHGGSFDTCENIEDTGTVSYDLFHSGGVVYIENYNDEKCDFSMHVGNIDGSSVTCSDQYLICDEEGVEFQFAEPGKAYVRKSYEVYLDFGDANGGYEEIGVFAVVPASIYLPDGNIYPNPDMMQFSHYEYNGTTYHSHESIEVTELADTYVKVIWKDQVPCDVTFYANDGTDESVTLTVWSVYQMPDAPPEGITLRDDHTFSHWTTAPVGGVVTQGRNILEGDTSFYAQWDCIYPENGICSCGNYEPAVYSSGDYQIENIGNLYWFAENARLKDGKLTTDLDLEGREWTPIGTAAVPFEGIFDGQGYDIKNFKITATGDSTGFFGAVDGATIKNVELAGEITVTQSELTGIGTIGKASGSTNISNVTSHINLTVDIDNSSAVGCGYSFGGLVGYSNGKVTIQKCIYDGTINAEDNWIEHAGGILGAEASGGVTQISDCANYGDFVTAMTGNYNGNSYTGYGGLVGYMGNSNSKISNSIFCGDIDCAGANVKLRDFSSLGYFENATVSNLYCKNSFYDANNNALEDSDGNSVSVVLGTAGTAYADQCTVTTEDMLKSGYVAYHLGDAWGQTIGSGSKPILNGAKVYKYLDGYSNELKFGFAGYTTDGAVFNIPTAGEYVLVFADYDNGRLNSIDMVTVTVAASAVGEITNPGELGVTIGTGDKIMLWKGTSTLTPTCESLLVE